MLKKILLVLLILSPSAVYLYIANKQQEPAPSTSNVAKSDKAHNPYQTPEH
ncbi:hypothetical protein [Acinetobacter sp. ANC 4173]|jgi:hypothetical protein|uniref:hypothetical protein n=1 Tax=Acinetobacter sp. ANC 4173 TaxID=2529837 RepID=UPI0013F16A83|nr:hypothetical protein [Acinetobacter sp. ANC 4173]